MTRVERWVGAAALAVLLAITPGVLRLLSVSAPEVERPPIALATLPVTSAGAGEVVIAAPEQFEGEVAVPTAPAPTFDRVTAQSETGEVFALLVGIDDYPGRAGDLRSAVADVDLTDAALEGFGVPAGNRVVLRDGQATKPQVTRAIQALVTQGGPDATYVLGYAGHARKIDRDTEAIVLADGEVVRDTELAALLAPATTQRVWLLMASCFAGGFTELLAPGRVLTGASGANQLAWEDPRLNASYLIHHLVREGWLEGHAGRSVQEAFAYADATLARERPNRRPVQVDQSGQRLVLGLGDPAAALGIAPPEPKPAPDPSPPPSPPPTTAPPTTAPPKEEESCLLGLLC